jgi:hypothetical protein
MLNNGSIGRAARMEWLIAPTPLPPIADYGLTNSGLPGSTLLTSDDLGRSPIRNSQSAIRNHRDARRED